MWKIFENQKYVFLNALILAVFIFALGLVLGFWIESSRLDKINSIYTETELNLLDIRVMPELLSNNFSCQQAIQANIDFGDRIYEDAKLLQDYEDVERISSDIKIQHYKYDLMRALFLSNSLKIKKQCSASFHTIVYFYQYNSPSLEVKSKQQVFSNILGELKQRQGDNVMLIPIAGDIPFSSINMIVSQYDITQLPTILIDEKTKITEVEKVDDIEVLLQ